MFAMSAIAGDGVCKIGDTEYESLQAAFDSKKSAKDNFTITLLKDIDVTSEITIPRFSQKVCTVDGDGHFIRQAYAGRMFSATASIVYVVFRNVTILGGGETYRTDADASNPGVAFYLQGAVSSLTFDFGCVISNFVYHSILIGADNESAKWNIYMKPGSVIANNRASASPGLFRMRRYDNGYALHISGGEIYGNSASSQTIAFLDAQGKSRVDPIFVMSGGYIHDNKATDDGSCLFYCDYGPIDVSMSGGEIFGNVGTVFHIARGGGSLSRIHVSGGKIFANTGYAVYSYQRDSTCCMFLSGNAIVAGNGLAGWHGLFERAEYSATARTALEGNFTGYAYLSGEGNGSTHEVGYAYGTNLASHVGAENIRLSEHDPKLRVLVTNPETGNLVWAEPNSAKIGTTEYATFESALSDAADGTTIELLRDYVATEPIVPPSSKSITVDGAGHRIFRCGNIHLVDATASGGNMTFTNVELNEGYFTCRDSYTNHVDGVLVKTHDGVAATVKLGPGTILSGGRGTNALVRVANGATVNLDGCVITGAVNRAVAASAGGTLGVKGATIVKNNAGGDIDVANGNTLSLNGDLTGSVHVTVAGEEAREGQRFGARTGAWLGVENFINGGDDPKLFVTKCGALVWCRRGFVISYR